MKKTLYYARKEQGICTNCGHEPASEGRTLCAACAEKEAAKKRAEYAEKSEELLKKKREDTAWYKARGICTACHHEKAAAGRARCPACLYALRLYKKPPRSEATKELERQRSRQRRDDLRAAGICTVCGKRPAEPHTICDYCRARSRNVSAERRLAAGVMPRHVMGDGYHCAICGSTDLQPGKKLCRKHYAEKSALVKRVHREWVESRKAPPSAEAGGE